MVHRTSRVVPVRARAFKEVFWPNEPKNRRGNAHRPKLAKKPGCGERPQRATQVRHTTGLTLAADQHHRQLAVTSPALPTRLKPSATKQDAGLGSVLQKGAQVNAVGVVTGR